MNVKSRVSKGERLDRLVQKCRDRVDALDAPPRSLSQAPDSKLRVLLDEAGYSRLSQPLLVHLDAELRQVGVGTFPELTDPTNTRDTRIYLFDIDHPIPGLQPARVLFSVESDLELFLVNNFRAMDFFRTRQLRLRGRQVAIAPGCVVDLLAEHNRNRELVGIELKVKEPDERLLSQCDKYLAALANLAAREERPGARLLIITGQPDERTRQAVDAESARFGVPVEWLLYRLQLRLKPV